MAKKYFIQYRINKEDYKFVETKKNLKKWAIEEMNCLPETISRNSVWIYSGETITGDEITFWKVG